MSDLLSVLDNVPTKRKSTSDSAPAAKKARTSGKAAVDAHAGAKNLIAQISMFPTSFAIPESEADVREMMLKIAAYAKSLEGGKSAVEPPKKTEAQVEAAALKVAGAACSGIKKQMAWKPSCKTGSAKWVYDGVCNDPDVFAKLMRSDTRITWKAKKFSPSEFEALLGETIYKSVRYDTLSLTGDSVNVRWDEKEGTFKFSGTYGK